MMCLIFILLQMNQLVVEYKLETSKKLRKNVSIILIII